MSASAMSLVGQLRIFDALVLQTAEDDTTTELSHRLSLRLMNRPGIPGGSVS